MLPKRLLLLWLPFVIVSTVLCGLVYLSVQQNYRMSANDPQIQIAEDIATGFQTGMTSPQAFVSPYKIDMANSLGTFVMIFDKNRNNVASNVQVDGKTPSLPKGVFDYVDKRGENRFTWQPKPGVRSAVVVVSYKDQKEQGYILVGRSMREVEIREENLTKMIFVFWLVSLIGTYIPLFLLRKTK